MASFVLHQGDAQIVANIRAALGGKIPTTVTLRTEKRPCLMGDPVIKEQKLKLKGVAFGKEGLIFTFDGDVKYILEPGDELSIVSRHFPFPYSGSYKVITFHDWKKENKSIKVQISKQ